MTRGTTTARPSKMRPKTAICVDDGVMAGWPARLTTQLRHSRPLASDLPTEAFNDCCLERLVSPITSHTHFLIGTGTRLPSGSTQTTDTDCGLVDAGRRTAKSRL